jgi:hypothetical protein
MEEESLERLDNKEVTIVEEPFEDIIAHNIIDKADYDFTIPQ